MSKYVIELMRRLTVKEIEKWRNEKMIESVSKGERDPAGKWEGFVML